MSSLRQGVVSVFDRVPGPLARRFRSDGMASRAVRPIVNHLLPTGPVTVRVRSGLGQGLALRIDPRSEKFYWTGAYEPAVLKMLERLLRPGMVVWDVGAHIGFISLVAARLVGRDGYVEAFEPMPETQKRLHEAIALNGARNIRVHAVAAAASNGTALMYRGAATSTSSLIGNVGPKGSLRVQTRTLDAIARFARDPNLIKVDIEGAEVDVLRAAVDFLARRRPYLVLESLDPALLVEAREVLPFYAFDSIDPRHWLLSAR
jgi:FkbM family methyltransferase